MEINNFTPITALIGGSLIGLSAIILLASNGKLAGISGVIGGVLTPSARSDMDWRILFLPGLLLGAFLYRWLFDPLTPISLHASTVAVVVGGILTGFGTSIGNGCTSGHGVCGLAQRSLRSLVATMSFMVTGTATVYLLRHTL